MAYFSDSNSSQTPFTVIQGPATPPNEIEGDSEQLSKAQIPSLSALLAKHSISRTISPPTPAASPQPFFEPHSPPTTSSTPWSQDVPRNPLTLNLVQNADSLIESTTKSYPGLNPADRRRFLTSLMPLLSGSDLLQLSALLTPLLKRDFLSDLPTEIGLHVLSFIEDARDLVRASRVCKTWRSLVLDEQTWKQMCDKHRFGAGTVAHAVRASAGLPGVLSLRTAPARRPLVSRTGFTLNREENTAEQTPTLPITSAQVAAAAGDGQETPAIAPPGMSPELWAMQGLGILRQTPRSSALSALGMTASTATPRNANSAFVSASPVVPIAIESPIPRRLAAAPLSVEIPRAPRLGASPLDLDMDAQVEDSPPSPTENRFRHAPARVERPATIETVMEAGPSRILPQLPAPVPLPVSRPPQTTITLSPRAAEVAPTDATRRYEQYALLSTGSLLSPGHYTSNPFGMAKIRPSSRSASAEIFGPGSARPEKDAFSYQSEFKRAYLTESNWLRGPGRVLSTQAAADDGVVTSLGFDAEYIVVGMATKELHVFDAESGDYARSLVGHTMGIWALALISRGSADKGKERESAPMVASGSIGPNVVSPGRSSGRKPGLHRRPSSFGSSRDFEQAGFNRFAGTNFNDHRASAQQANMCGNIAGWGQPHALAVSAGCDRTVRLWDVTTGECLQVLEGHTSTVRCLKVVDGQPIAVTGSRDTSVRVWDLSTGRVRHIMLGHLEPVRCLEISGMKVVSGSYDNTARLWDIETGQCLFVFSGHYYQIYAVAFDGQRVVTGSLDSTVRIWSARTGDCLALLQGHTSLVGQLQLTDSVLVTGGSDGRVIVFSLATLECLHRICAHDNSVTCLQFDDRFIVTGGNDGRVKLFDFKTGQFIRELAEPCEAVWRVTFREDKCVILCKRSGRTTMSVITFRPDDADL